jgi:hypothetical protein
VFGKWLEKWISRLEGRGFHPVGEMSKLPQSDRVAVMRAVRWGKPVSDPRLAPAVVAWANATIARAQRRRFGPLRWVLLALAAVSLAFALIGTISGATWDVVGSGVWAVLFLYWAFETPWARMRQRARAEAAADLAADQMAGFSAECPPPSALS